MRRCSLGSRLVPRMITPPSCSSHRTHLQRTRSPLSQINTIIWLVNFLTVTATVRSWYDVRKWTKQKNKMVRKFGYLVDFPRSVLLVAPPLESERSWKPRLKWTDWSNVGFTSRLNWLLSWASLFDHSTWLLKFIPKHAADPCQVYWPTRLPQYFGREADKPHVQLPWK